MIFEMAEGLVSGGWNALTNITSGIGKGISQIGSTFFPAPQRTVIKSEITKAAGSTGMTYRPTAVDAPSTWETMQQAAMGWEGSPYAEQFAITVKNDQAMNLAEKVSSTKQEGIGGMFADIMGGLEFAGKQSQSISTLVDQIMGPWSPRETVRGTPQAGYPEGRDEGHLNNLSQKGAEVFATVKAGAEAIFDQVKGLFNIGFGQQGSQPVFGIQHELSPSKGLSAGLIIAGVVIVLIILLSRKK